MFGSQRAVRAVVADEVLEVGKQGHPLHSLPLRHARVHGVAHYLRPAGASSGTLGTSPYSWPRAT